MRNPRLYIDIPLTVGSTVELSADAFGHAIRVLRLKQGDQITLFNGQWHDGEALDFNARLTEVTKKTASATLESSTVINSESPVSIHLGQGISRGDRMDFTLQKSVELGVSQITPIFTERCGVKLSGERLAKKVDQWQKIVISACEQSGRAIVPKVNEPLTYQQWLANDRDELKLNLHPKATQSIMTLPMDTQSVQLLIGPEGGLSDEEIQLANDAGYQDVLLGPRVLRTETAALTAITALQCRLGDLA
ncbi:16S rRNA (uracil(1498)-N(3))-methyltransferase [Thalassotalea agarivorans]|uniref:Ribosomal RNA small subunit methyltransferase E n=1 Tax=Thalassotalea agarivorans TaxID=349064 RepID=A0A1I0HG26_THASX|nr:16S rRNA (uracil(1498)-N(3))-methyltransferase [Thalassotalea agarivorans]SET82844.1 16S rRNA m(3)U-1498 methyltransferase [Thalassotalea agarivorans]